MHTVRVEIQLLDETGTVIERSHADAPWRKLLMVRNPHEILQDLFDGAVKGSGARWGGHPPYYTPTPR